MASVSGLSAAHRVRARDRAVQAALLGYHHNSAIHYTQGASRWDGIRKHRNARLGQYPTFADCSAYVTWCIWNGVYLSFGVRDVVNGQHWNYGFTGTMLAHGKPVRKLSNVVRADAVIYGNGGNGEHTAIVVGRKGGVPMVVSHGSERGPLYVPYNYRRDIMSIRRYI